jgi:hypothetical protein
VLTAPPQAPVLAVPRQQGRRSRRRLARRLPACRCRPSCSASPSSSTPAPPSQPRRLPPRHALVARCGPAASAAWGAAATSDASTNASQPHLLARRTLMAIALLGTGQLLTRLTSPSRSLRGSAPAARVGVVLLWRKAGAAVLLLLMPASKPLSTRLPLLQYRLELRRMRAQAAGVTAAASTPLCCPQTPAMRRTSMMAAAMPQRRAARAPRRLVAGRTRSSLTTQAIPSRRRPPASWATLRRAPCCCGCARTLGWTTSRCGGPPQAGTRAMTRRVAVETGLQARVRVLKLLPTRQLGALVQAAAVLWEPRLRQLAAARRQPQRTAVASAAAARAGRAAQSSRCTGSPSTASAR